jgi:hypothetical protein
MSIDFQFPLGPPLLWADVLLAVRLAAAELLRVRTPPLLTVREWGPW